MNLKLLLFSLLNIHVLSFLNIFSKFSQIPKNIDEISFGELINKIDSNLVDKLIMGSEGKDIILIDKSIENSIDSTNILNNIHHTKIEPFVLQNIITKSIENHINIGFYNSNELNFGMILENYIIPLIVLSITWNFLSTFISIFININKKSGQNSQNSNLSNFFTNPFEKKNEIDNNKNNFNVSLSSWVGSPEAFEECYEVISYVKNASNYEKMGVELPKGILLEGPPGVGKTLLAKAIASETNSTFISVSGSEFIELFVGMGAKRVRDLFEEAREKSPCIIFIDEIDAIGKQRGNSNNFGGNDEREQTLNQLLAEMDGFNNNDGIIVLASTNRKDILDKALIRPGRFDRIINIPLPDLISRKQIIELYLKKKNINSNVDLNINTNFLAELTDGFSGAELKNVINEAAILAARLGLEKITINELLNAIEKSIVGLIKNTDTRQVETKLRISYHEIGHAFLAMYYSKYFDLQKISIKSTYNGAGGYTLFNEKNEYRDGGLYTKDMLFKRLIVTMGGKAAESIWYNTEDISLGATQDLKQANQLARKMIGLFGMGEKLETFYNDESNYETNNKFSEKIKQTFDTESLKLVSDAFIKAKEILTDNKIICEELANLLLEKQVLNIDDFSKFYKNIVFKI